MNKRYIGILSVVLAMAVGFGALIAVPLARAADTAVTIAPSATGTAAVEAKLATLKTLGQQISAAAKTIQEKVKAAKAAGKDLASFKAEIAIALKGGRNLRLGVARIRRPGLTAAERTQVRTAQTAIATLRKNLQARTKAGAQKTELHTLKANIKIAIQARNALVKSFRLGARAQMLGRLDNLITDASRELTSLNTLLAKLP